MGSRRLGRQRLYALNKEGQQLTKTAGVGMTDNIGSSTIIRSGTEMVSEITIDLGSSKGAAYSFPTSGTYATTNTKTARAIGVSASSGYNYTVHGNAQCIQLDFTGSNSTYQGLVTSGELICVEAPVGGGAHIGLWWGVNASGSGAEMDSDAGEIIQPQAMTIVENHTFDLDVDLDNKYIYLVHSGSGDAAYTAGKFILRFYGFNQFTDV